MALSLENYFSLDSTKQLIYELKSLGLKMKPSKQKAEDGHFQRKNLCINGNIAHNEAKRGV